MQDRQRHPIVCWSDPMIETLAAAFAALLTIQHLAYMLLGVAVGLTIGRC
jgi:TctA family transporter